MSNLTSQVMLDGTLRKAQLKMLAMLQQVDLICQKYNLEYWLEGGTLLGAMRHQGFVPWDDDLDISMPRASYEKFLLYAPQEIPEHMFLQTAKTDTGYFNLHVQLKIRDRNSRYLERHERGTEPYQQGVYIDIFVYDKKPANYFERRLYKVISRQLLNTLFFKYSSIDLFYRGRHGKTYERIAKFIPKTLLEWGLQSIIKRVNKSKSTFLGYGYDCRNSSYFKHNDFYPLKRAVFEGFEFNIPNKANVLLTHQFGDYLTLPPESMRVMKHCREVVILNEL